MKFPLWGPGGAVTSEDWGERGPGGSTESQRSTRQIGLDGSARREGWRVARRWPGLPCPGLAVYSDRVDCVRSALAIAYLGIKQSSEVDTPWPWGAREGGAPSVSRLSTNRIGSRGFVAVEEGMDGLWLVGSGG